MSRLLAAIRLESRLYLRQRLCLAALLAAGLAAAIVLAAPAGPRDRLLTGMLLAYALFCGFDFGCYRLLRDRRDGVLATLDMSPLRPLEYLASRILVLSALAVPGALLIALAGRGFRFAPLPLAAGLGAGTAFMALTGILAGAWHRTGRGFMLWSPAYALALAAPLFPYTGWGAAAGGPARASAWFFWHPLQGPVALLAGAFAGTDLPRAILGLGVSLLWAGAALVLCKRALGRLRERGGQERGGA